MSYHSKRGYLLVAFPENFIILQMRLELPSKFYSSSYLANRYRVPLIDLFSAFKRRKYINRLNNKWDLSDKAKDLGAKVIEHHNYRVFLWPENFIGSFGIHYELGEKPLKVEAIAQHFNTSTEIILEVFSDIKLIEITFSGHVLTKLGKRIGAEEVGSSTDNKKILWPKSVLEIRKVLYFFKEQIEAEKKQKRSKPKKSGKKIKGILRVTHFYSEEGIVDIKYSTFLLKS